MSNSWRIRVAGAGLALSLFVAGCADATPGPGSTPSTFDVVSTLQLPQLRLTGDVIEAVDGAVLASVEGQRLLLPRTLAFDVDPTPGTPFVVNLPATTATVVALTPQVLTLQAPTLGLFQVPATLIPSDLLAQTRVQVQHENGNIVTVPLNAALNMIRAQPGSRLVADTGALQLLPRGAAGQAIFLGDLRSDEHLLLANVNGQLQLVRVDADAVDDVLPGSPLAFDWEGDRLAFTPWGGGDVDLNVKRREGMAPASPPGRNASPRGRETARLGSARAGSARAGSARAGSARPGSARPGSARPCPAPVSVR